MKWSSRLKIFIAVLSVFFCSSVLSSSAYADFDVNYDGYYNHPEALTYRTFSIGNSIYNNQNWGYQETPFTLISRSSGATFWGVLSQVNVPSSIDFNPYTTIYASAELDFASYDLIYTVTRNFDTALAIVLSDGSTETGSCTQSYSDGHVRVDCSTALPQYLTPTRVSLRIGLTSVPDSSSSSYYFEPSVVVSTSDLRYSFLGWGYVTSSSEEVSYLSLLTEQNQIMIEQNSQTNSLLQDQNEQQQSQYEAEKAEEAAREEAGSEDMATVAGMFNFNVLNPFAGIWSLFKNNNACVSIPILAGMLNTSETTYCPWFPASVRNILTPVFGLLSMIILFGFFVRWLSARSDSVTKGGK